MKKHFAYAEVILPVPVDQTFTYGIPDDLSLRIEIGMRVIVQFGKRKLYSGLVYDLHNNKPEIENLKSIEYLIDERPLIDNNQLKFWDWMADYYMCAKGEIFKAALPSGLKLESESKILVNESFDLHCLKNDRYKMIYKLATENAGISVNDLSRKTRLKNIYADLNFLIEEGAVIMEERLKEKIKSKKELFLKVNPDILFHSEYEETLERLAGARKQKELLQELVVQIQKSGDEQREFSFAYYRKNYAAATINALVLKGFLFRFEKEVNRIDDYTGDTRDIYKLSTEQDEAYNSIKSQWKEKDVVLLHGVTSSGKTEVYIHLIQETIDQGKQVLYLLPEIALTSQIVNRLREVFGDKIGVYHSRFADSERVEVYKRLKEDREDNFQIILGVRSAIFLAFKNLGLIIVDEEHENTYKQFDPAPRYNARDSAIVLGSIHKAKVLLGTATPSIESFTNSKTGKFGYVRMEKRFGNVKMPEIRVADVRKARLKKQMRSVFTPLLMDEIKDAIDRNKQVILFQNRRGFSSFLECETCGWVPRCNTCDVSLTYHKFTNQLICHYCGYSVKIPEKCSECNSTRLATRGFGTELVEDEIGMFLPGVKVARLDLDTSRNRGAYEKILNGFGKGDIDILVGTQMLSKGLDFENVSLVGIVNADQMLNYPDFRAFERSYQLMAQVSGRAGRKKEQGKVIIQAADPSHPVIRHVINNDYDAIYKEQYEERQMFGYPPFVRLVRIILKGRDFREVELAANLLSDALRSKFGKRVLGPQIPLVGRIKSMYIQHIILKIERKASFKKARGILRVVLEELSVGDEFRNVRVNLDVDPS